MSAGSCQTFSSDFCNPVIASYPGHQVYQGTLALTVIDGVLESEIANFTLVAQLLAPTCFELGRKLLCGNYFPPCSNVSCQSVPS